MPVGFMLIAITSIRLAPVSLMLIRLAPDSLMLVRLAPVSLLRIGLAPVTIALLAVCARHGYLADPRLAVAVGTPI
jgi:hypothetical protein